MAENSPQNYLMTELTRNHGPSSVIRSLNTNVVVIVVSCKDAAAASGLEATGNALMREFHYNPDDFAGRAPK